MFAGFLEGLRSLALSSSFDGRERREVVRLRCYYPVTCFTDKGRQAHSARVTEMSLKGMRLLGPRKISRGAELFVTYTDADGNRRFKKESVRCKVVWCQRRPTGEYRIGVTYEDSRDNLGVSWVKVILQELGFNEENIYQRRRHVRFPAHVNADLVAADGSRLALAEIVDLGVGGALLRCQERLVQKSMIRLALGPYANLPRTRLSGMVVGTRPDPDRPGERLHNFRFAHLEEDQVKLLGKYLIHLLREGSS